MKHNSEINILVAMSGGVDSSVVAALLVEQGYNVTGAYMKQWSDTKDLNGTCTWKQDRRDAMRVAAQLGIPFRTLDFEDVYREKVVSYLFDAYAQGLTPNPDVLCNQYVKFDAWLNYAKAEGFDYLATGHYARVQQEGDTFQLLSGVDRNKDQTYFLHQLNQSQLASTMFPLGEMIKDDVRAYAKEKGLITAQKEESMGICFIGEVPMKEFLMQKIDPTPGPICLPDDSIVGQHDGLSFYTIGQRHVGKIDLKTAQKAGEDTAILYVVGKDKETNTLLLGSKEDPRLYTSKIVINNIHWIAGQAPQFPLECKGRFRHRQALQDMQIVFREETYHITLKAPQRALTPGQFLVLYDGDVCLGGVALKEKDLF